MVVEIRCPSLHCGSDVESKEMGRINVGVGKKAASRRVCLSLVVNYCEPLYTLREALVRHDPQDAGETIRTPFFS